MAFLFGLVMPAVSQAMSHAGHQQAGALVTEICSASGTRHALVFDDAAPTTAPAVPDMSHCDLCCPQHHAWLAPPPGSLSLLALERQRDPCPPLFYHAPRRQHAWTPVQSRGPPSSLS